MKTRPSRAGFEEQPVFHVFGPHAEGLNPIMITLPRFFLATTIAALISSLSSTYKPVLRGVSSRQITTSLYLSPFSDGGSRMLLYSSRRS
jgi:hypothetical protein